MSNKIFKGRWNTIYYLGRFFPSNERLADILLGMTCGARCSYEYGYLQPTLAIVYHDIQDPSTGHQTYGKISCCISSPLPFPHRMYPPHSFHCTSWVCEEKVKTCTTMNALATSAGLKSMPWLHSAGNKEGAENTAAYLIL